MIKEVKSELTDIPEYKKRDKEILINTIVSKWDLGDAIEYIKALKRDYMYSDKIQDCFKNLLVDLISEEFDDCETEFDFVNQANLRFLISPANYRRKY